MMIRTPRLARRFRQISWQDRVLLLDALLWIGLARLAIVALPFRQIGRLASLHATQPEPPPVRRADHVRRVRWAIEACARHVPWRALCYEQGLAAQIMLRRRGVPVVFFYGAAPDEEKGLSAHVWVRDGDIDVVGGAVASRFAVLAVFPQHKKQE